MTKLKQLYSYSKYKSLEIPDLFKLSVGRFMYSFYSGGSPNQFDNYFAEITSVHKYQTRLASLQKYYLPRMKTSLGQLSLKYIGPKIWSNIPENLKSSSPSSFGKENIETSGYLARIPVDLRFICLSHFVILCWCHFSLLSPTTVGHPTPVHRYAFLPLFFAVVVFFILPDNDLMLFYYFFTACKTSSIKLWFVLATGLAENLTQVVFHQPFVIQHVRTPLKGWTAKPEISDIFIFHQHEVNLWSLMLLYLPLLHLCCFVIWVTNLHE